MKNYIRSRPFCISFEVTHNCNAKCRHCHLGGIVEENRATPQTYGKICRELKPLIAQASGGEPLLRKDLEQIIEEFRIPDRAPYITLTTNGALLTKKRFCSLLEAGVDEFSISLDYPDERHDEFRSIPGLFKKIESLIQELDLGMRNHITLCCVIQSNNFRSLTLMAELASRWNVKINFSPYTMLRTQDRIFMISQKDWEEFDGEINRLLDKKNQTDNIHNSNAILMKTADFFKKGRQPYCRTGERFINVNPDGTFSPCGLIIKDYKSRDELHKKFTKNNTCEYCYTSIRANSERSLKNLIKDSLDFL